MNVHECPDSFIQCAIVSRWSLITKDGLSHYRRVTKFIQQLASIVIVTERLLDMCQLRAYKYLLALCVILSSANNDGLLKVTL